MVAITEKQEEEVIELLKEYIPDASIETLDRNLSDLNIDSMDFITLVFDVEDKYAVSIETSDIDMNQTLRQLLDSLPAGATS